MENYLSPLPLAISLLFIVSFVVAIVIIATAAKQAALSAGITKEKSRNIQIGVYCFCVLWLLYASVLSLKGVFHVNSLPPKVILFTTLPLLLFLFFVVGKSSIFKKMLTHISLSALIRIHRFRFIGVFFILIYFFSSLPAKFAFAAGLGDITSAAIALLLSRAVAEKKSWSIKLAYVWNIFGLVDILVVIVSAILITKAAMVSHTPGNLAMTLFPFVWLPAFAPATILFLHVCIFKKLREEQ